MNFSPIVHSITIFSPAKINLFLAITGRRPDGYHDLVSLVAPLSWGDELKATAADGFSLTCSDPAVPVDASNLVLKAARAFGEATGWPGGAVFHLEKRIPMGAGLGGGSSNAVAALQALNQLAGRPLSAIRLAAVAARLGADCALFAAGEPLIMRNRGDRIERLSDAEAARLRGQRVLVFKPDFGIGTAWAYGRMATDPTRYLPAVEAEARLAAWRAEAVAPLESLAYNNMEAVAFAKFLALPALHAELFERFGVTARMSGSGSASFLILREDMDEEAIRDCVRTAWGAAAFVLTTAIV